MTIVSAVVHGGVGVWLSCSRTLCSSCGSIILSFFVLLCALLLHRDHQSLGKLGVVREVITKTCHGSGTTSVTTSKHIIDHTVGTISGCTTHITIAFALENWGSEQDIGDHGNTKRHVQEATVVTLVGIVDQGLKLGDVFRVGKVDHIDGDVVQFEVLSESFELTLLFDERVSTEDDDSRLRVLVHSVLQ